MMTTLAFLSGLLITAAVALYRERRRARRESRAIERLLAGFELALAGEHGALFSGEETALAAFADELTKAVAEVARRERQTAAAKAALAKSLADLAHQLKTPIASLRLLSDLAEAALPPAQRSVSAAERRQLDRLEELVQGILTLARVDAGTLPLAATRLDGVDLAYAVEAALSPLLEGRSQTLHMEVPDDLHWQGDRRWTTEILINLVKNASDASADDATVHLSARSAAPLYIEWQIRDAGPGIDATDLPHLFERFYRGKNARSDGVGIGLSLARELALAQGGSLEASNAPEGGALFTLRFYTM